VSDVEMEPSDDEAPEEGTDAEAPEVAESAEEAEPSPLELVTAERDRLKDQLLRVAADFDNFRKRSRKDVEQAERRGKEEILRELLPVIDNLERAVEAARGATEVDGIVQGVEMVLKLFEDTASRIGLERIESVGERFDPSLHDAFQQQESDEHPPGTIMAQYQAGYRLGDRLIRPATVVVSKKRPEPAGQDQGG
jgi:molecular chaperone GrpE